MTTRAVLARFGAGHVLTGFTLRAKRLAWLYGRLAVLAWRALLYPTLVRVLSTVAIFARRLACLVPKLAGVARQTVHPGSFVAISRGFFRVITFRTFQAGILAGAWLVLPVVAVLT